MLRDFRRWQASSLDNMIMVQRLRGIFDTYFSLGANDINSMLFVGGSGLGKTTLARLIGKHFDWGKVERLQLTDDQFYKGDTLDSKLIARRLSGITSQGSNLTRFFDSVNKRSRYILDELQQLTKSQQRRLNDSLEELADGVCIIATMNVEYKGAGSNSTLSRMEVIDFDIIQQKQHRDELINDMVRVSKVCIKDIGAKDDILTEDDLRAIAKRTHYDFRDFFITLGREYVMKEQGKD
jgi:replication-associated recombination protein RarA